MHIELTILRFPSQTLSQVEVVAGPCRILQVMRRNEDALVDANELAKLLGLRVRLIEHTARKVESTERVDGKPTELVHYE
jgi:hypothetical protein